MSTKFRSSDTPAQREQKETAKLVARQQSHILLELIEAELVKIRQEIRKTGVLVINPCFELGDYMRFLAGKDIAEKENSLFRIAARRVTTRIFFLQT